MQEPNHILISQVSRVESQARVQDSAADGALIGLIAGGAGGTIIGGVVGQIWSNEGKNRAPVVVALGLAGGGLGALFGYAGDSALRRREVLYRSK